MPEGLRARGARLWAAWVGRGVLEGTPAGEVALEACRTADRLDWLEEYIARESAVQMLGEARQQALAFARLSAEVERLAGELSPAEVEVEQHTAGGGSVVDEIRARREARTART